MPALRPQRLSPAVREAAARRAVTLSRARCYLGTPPFRRAAVSQDQSRIWFTHRTIGFKLRVSTWLDGRWLRIRARLWWYSSYALADVFTKQHHLRVSLEAMPLGEPAKLSTSRRVRRRSALTKRGRQGQFSVGVFSKWSTTIVSFGTFRDSSFKPAASIMALKESCVTS